MREDEVARLLGGDEVTVTREMLWRLLEAAERGELSTETLANVATVVLDSDRLGCDDEIVASNLHDWSQPDADLVEMRRRLAAKLDPAERRRQIALAVFGVLSAAAITIGLVWFAATRGRIGALLVILGFACLLPIFALKPSRSARETAAPPATDRR